MATPGQAKQGPTAKHALSFVVIIGVLSFFADFTYEGARSITGPFLASLGCGRFCGLSINRVPLPPHQFGARHVDRRFLCHRHGS